MDLICPANRTYTPQLDPRPDPFSVPRSVSRAHNFAIRGGRTSNITVLMDDDTSEEADEYLRGVVLSSIIIGVIFICWILLLLLFKCPCWSRKVGFLSGHALRLPLNEEEQEEQEDEKPEETSNNHQPGIEQDHSFNTDKSFKDEPNKASKTGEPTTTTDEAAEDDPSTASEKQAKAVRIMTRLRYIAAFAGVGIIIGGFIMLRRGVVGLEDSISDTTVAFVEAHRLTNEGAFLIDTFAERQKPLLQRINDAQPALNGFCPNVRKEICQVVDSVDGESASRVCNFTDIPLADALQKIQIPDLANSLIFDDLEKASEDLRELGGDFLEYEQDVEDLEWPFKAARAFSWLLILLDLFLMICLAHAWRADARSLQQTPEERAQPHPHPRRRAFFRWLQKWILMPLFVIMVILALLFSTLFTVASITSSDLCYDGPDEKIVTFLNVNEDDLSALIHAFTVYYVDSCPPDRAPLDFADKLIKIKDIFDPLAEFLDSIRDSEDDILAVCGGDTSVVVGAAQLLLDQICVVRDTLLGVALFMSCANWHPLYAAVAHNAVCSNATYGFHWLATSQFVVVLFAMILLSVRASLYEMERPGDEKNWAWEMFKKHLMWQKTTTSVAEPGELALQEGGSEAGDSTGIKNEQMS